MYRFYFGRDVLPVTPGAINTTIKNQNKTITLINEGEVNLIKEAGLTEFSFKFMLPWCNYPFVNINYPSALTSAMPTLSSVLSGKWKLSSAINSLKSITLKSILEGDGEQLNIFPSQKEWIEKLTKYKKEKKVLQFKVQRIDSGLSLNAVLDKGTGAIGDVLKNVPITGNINLNGWTTRTGHVQFAGWTTDMLVTLEELKIVEDSKEYKDVWVEVKLKEFKPYGTKLFEEKDGKIVEKNASTEAEAKAEADKEKQKQASMPNQSSMSKDASKHYQAKSASIQGALGKTTTRTITDPTEKAKMLEKIRAARKRSAGGAVNG